MIILRTQFQTQSDIIYTKFTVQNIPKPNKSWNMDYNHISGHIPNTQTSHTNIYTYNYNGISLFLGVCYIRYVCCMIPSLHHQHVITKLQPPTESCAPVCRLRARQKLPGLKKTFTKNELERSTMLLMGKSIISMAIFNSKLLVYQRVYHHISH